MIASERKHRHWQLTLRRESLVIDRVLIEGSELIKCRMHGAGACVEARIMAPCRLIDRLRIGGKLIPEPVQVNAFAAFDQPLNVRPAEIEMPQSRATDYFVPRADSGKRGVNNDPACHTRRKLCSER